VSWESRVKAIGTDDADKVSEQMRKTKINDFMTNDGWIREDGRIMRDMYLERVKSPEESKYPFDYFKVLATIPADEAFRSLKDGIARMSRATERGARQGAAANGLASR
jgi:branched-chain amino acid transport system substrate-binding protein